MSTVDPITVTPPTTPDQPWMAFEKLDDDWAARAEITIRPDGQPIVASLTIEPHGTAPPGGLITRLARSVRVDAMLRVVAKQLAEQAGEGADSATATIPVTPRSKSGWRSDHEIVNIAIAYIRAAHDSRSPIRDLARTLELDERYIRETVAEARRRGLLTSPGASRPGGVLTEKGRGAACVELVADR